ncbi:P-loop containing nucleoside triphosphate hydrolase protein [Meredithblackwellia eburnea MCA 4105]
MDSDDDIDISAALIPNKSATTASKPKKQQQVKNGKKKQQVQHIQEVKKITSDDDYESEQEQDQDDEDDGDIFANLAQLTKSRNMAEGTAIVKERKDHKTQKGLTGGGSFQSLGLPPPLLRALLQRGFTTPTPIQRLALPSILGASAETVVSAGKKVLVARDHLCMARTGSGKTLCYLLPLLAQLMSHSTAFGARGLILVPTRELALQVLKVGKDLARAIKGEGEALRWAMIVGGEGMEEQFAMMAGNPDVIIATPGRLLHLIVEMSLDLRGVQYCVFDEADRLFELGFSEQLHEILHKMPPTRQTLLFSATLPSSLVGFAKAGLQNPKLIRLDVDSKISKDLQMAYLSVKASEKEALLLSTLREVIAVPLMTDHQRKLQDAWVADDDFEGNGGGDSKSGGGKGKGKRGVKRKRGDPAAAGTLTEGEIDPSAKQTLVFVATKHHVEYISTLLSLSGYAVSSIYGSMDQTARRLHLARFRAGSTSILVVTDLAARGIDVPGVENVINYDFPNGTRAFVHRVGRTARAGRKGWAYTFITANDLPHLLDLELFLTRPVKTCPILLPSVASISASSSTTTAPATAAAEHQPYDEIDFADQLVLGTAPRALLDQDNETFRSLAVRDPNLDVLGDVARRGQKMYERGLQKASAESYRRAKLLQEKGTGLAYAAVGKGNSGVSEKDSVHPVFKEYLEIVGADDGLERKRAELLAKVTGFRPTETVFEVGTRGKTPAAQMMAERRRAMFKSEKARSLRQELEDDEEEEDALEELEEDDDDERLAKEASKKPRVEIDEADAEEVEAVFGAPRKRKPAKGAGASYRDPQFYLNYEQEGADTERGYALTAGDSFVAQAAHAQYDVSGRGDTEGTPADALLQRASTLRWDRRQKKFVKSDQVGADNKKLIRSESGQKLPASFRSGVFDEWKKKQRISVPKVGEAELKGRTVSALGGGPGGKRYRHKAGIPKADQPKGERQKGGRTVGKPGRPGSVGGGLRSAEQIRKERVAKAKRVARSTQPSKKNKGKK